MVNSNHLANEEGKEVSIECHMESCFVPKVLFPTSPAEDQTLLTSGQSGICCVMFFSFTHISY